MAGGNRDADGPFIMMQPSTRLFLTLLLWSLLAVTGFTGTLQAQEAGTPLTDEFLSGVRSETISLTGLVRTIGNYSFEDNDFNGGRSFAIGGARLGLRGRLDNRLTYRIQFRLEQSPNLLDAWLQYRLHDLIRLRAGAQKPQISAELIHSAGLTDFIDRARLTGRQLNSREIGVSLFGERNGLGYHAGIYNGSGVRPNPDNRFFYTFRTFYKLESSGENALEIGLNLAVGECFDSGCSPATMSVAGRRLTYGADMRVERGPWLLSGEYLLTRADIVHPTFSEEQVSGIHLTGGYRFTDRSRLLARWERLAYRESNVASERVIFGVNHQLSAILLFQFNLLTEFREAVDPRTGVSANLQIRF